MNKALFYNGGLQLDGDQIGYLDTALNIYLQNQERILNRMKRDKNKNNQKIYQVTNAIQTFEQRVKNIKFLLGEENIE